MLNWLDSLMEINSVLLSLFGIGIFGGLYKLTKNTMKFVKEKKEENKQNKEVLHQLILNDTKQDERLKELEKYNEMADRRTEYLSKAQKATLHNAIWNKSEIYLARGYVTIGELNNFDILYHAYKAVEGNHTGDMLHAKVKALPVKDEGILSRKEVR